MSEREFIDVTGWGRLFFWNTKEEDQANGTEHRSDGMKGETDEDQAFHGRLVTTTALDFPSF